MKLKNITLSLEDPVENSSVFEGIERHCRDAVEEFKYCREVQNSSKEDLSCGTVHLVFDFAEKNFYLRCWCSQDNCTLPWG